MPDENKNQTTNYDPENPRCDQEQLKFLKECIAEGPEGIEKWNKWYLDKFTKPWEPFYPLKTTNIEGTYHYGAHLEGAHLYKANLEGAFFMGAYLEGAYLMDAHLEKAVFNEANMKRIVLTGAHLEGANLREANLEGAELIRAHLEGAHLSIAHIKGATLMEAHLEKATLLNVHLENTTLCKANLENANLTQAHLEGTNLSLTNLEGATFSKAIVDGDTLIWACKVNRTTNFEAVGLNSMRIYPATKQLLEYNIRRMNWEAWYEYKDWDKISPKEKREKSSRFIRQPVKWFWAISDYGRSTWRIILTFLILAITFATIYFAYGAVDYYLLDIKEQPGIVTDLFVPVTAEKPMSNVYYGVIIYLRSLYFSVVTMTTLGFGDMFANTSSFGLRWWLGHLLLIVQVIFGYVLLGALVTRFAVLFTAGGPAGEFAEKSQ